MFQTNTPKTTCLNTHTHGERKINSSFWYHVMCHLITKSWWAKPIGSVSVLVYVCGFQCGFVCGFACGFACGFVCGYICGLFVVLPAVLAVVLCVGLSVLVSCTCLSSLSCQTAFVILCTFTYSVQVRFCTLWIRLSFHRFLSFTFV